MEIDLPEAQRLEAIRLATQLVSHTSGDPREVLTIARMFLAFLQGEVDLKDEPKLKVVS